MRAARLAEIPTRDSRPSRLHLFRYPPVFAFCGDKRQTTAKRGFVIEDIDCSRLTTPWLFDSEYSVRQARVTRLCYLRACLFVIADLASMSPKEWDRAAKQYGKSAVLWPVNCFRVHPILHFRSWVCAKPSDPLALKRSPGEWTLWRTSEYREGASQVALWMLARSDLSSRARHDDCYSNVCKCF